MYIGTVYSSSHHEMQNGNVKKENLMKRKLGNTLYCYTVFIADAKININLQREEDT